MVEPVLVKIGEICSIQKGSTGLATAIPGEYPLVTTGADRKTSKEFQFDAKAVCIPLVSSTGHGKKTLNYVHYQEGKFALGTILAALVPKDENIISARYLHMYLQKNKARVLVPLMQGGANVSLSIKAISNIEIPLPSLARQQELLSKIDRITKEYSGFLDETDIQKKLFVNLRKLVLQEAVEGKLTANWRKRHSTLISGENHASYLLKKIKTEKQRLVQEKQIKKGMDLSPILDKDELFDLPEEWVWCQIGDLGEIARGVSPKYCEGLEYKILNQKCVRWNQIDIQWAKNVLPEWYHRLNSKCLTNLDDVLVNSTGEGTIGRAGIVQSNAVGLLFDTHVLRVNTFWGISPLYLMYFINSIYGQKQILDLKGAKTTKQTELGVNNLSLMLFPLPPALEQKVILKQLTSLLSKIDDLDQQVNQRNMLSEMLTQAVIREAFANAV